MPAAVDTAPTLKRREPPRALELAGVEVSQLPPPRVPELRAGGTPELRPTRSLSLPAQAPSGAPPAEPAPTREVDPYFIHQAAFRRQPERVVELSASLSEAELLGPLGGLLARAYGQLTLQSLRAGRLEEALGHSSAMFSRVAAHTLPADEERHNRILAELKASGAEVSASAVQRTGPFSLSAGAPWRLVGLRKLGEGERPDPELVQRALAPAGAWLSPATPPEGSWRGQRLCYVGAEGAGELDGRRVAFSPSGARVTATLENLFGVYAPPDEELAVDRFSDDRRQRERAWAVRAPAGRPEPKGCVCCRPALNEPRCFAVAGDGDDYLLVLEDELWCVRDPQEPARWGLRMPPCKGWRRVTRARPKLPSPEVEAALATLGVEAPINRAQLVAAYQRAVAARTEDSPVGAEELRRALQIARRADLTDVLIWRERAEDEAEGAPAWGPLQYILHAQPRPEGGALFSTAAGVFCVDEEGALTRAFRVGAPVEQLAVVQGSLLISAGGSLYVIDAEGALRAQLELPDGAQLLTGQEGFLILQERSLEVFDPLGAQRGKISSERCLSCCFPSEAGLLIRTEEREICVDGLAP